MHAAHEADPLVSDRHGQSSRPSPTPSAGVHGALPGARRSRCPRGPSSRPPRSPPRSRRSSPSTARRARRRAPSRSRRRQLPQRPETRPGVLGVAGRRNRHEAAIRSPGSAEATSADRSSAAGTPPFCSSRRRRSRPVRRRGRPRSAARREIASASGRRSSEWIRSNLERVLHLVGLERPDEVPRPRRPKAATFSRPPAHGSRRAPGRRPRWPRVAATSTSWTPPPGARRPHGAPPSGAASAIVSCTARGSLGGRSRSCAHSIL